MDYQLKLVTAPAVEPLTVGGQKKELDILQHLNLPANLSAEETLYLQGLIRTARQWAENHTTRCFITQTWDLLLPGGFPFSEKYVMCCNEIRIPRAPVASITHVKYLDTNGTQQTLAAGATGYVAAVKGEPAIVKPFYGISWPAVRDNEVDVSGNYAVEVRVVAGYGSDGTLVPQPFRHAMSLLVGHWFHNREQVSDAPLSEIPTYGVETLLSQDRFFPW